MSENHTYLRFPRSYRLEHWLLVGSFTSLAVTGLIQKFATGSLSQWIIAFLGGIERVRIIHRGAAILLMLEGVYHLGVVGYRLLVHRAQPSMLPGLQDVRNAMNTLLYDLRLRHEKPRQGRYTFEEKFEYWGLIWGTAVMAITGFMMWNPIATTRYLPGQFIPAAKAAHSNEAMLAVLTIVIWHMYHVHIRHYNKSMISGVLSEEEMLEHHPLELADFEAGPARRPPPPDETRRRRRLFGAAFGIAAAGMLVGIYFFATFEQTAITTLPPAENVVVFAPLTPTPLPTPLPTKTPSAELPTSWEDGFQELLDDRCGGCHGGASRVAGLDLGSYQGALAGGSAGPAVVPGDPDSSTMLARQAAGDHPGQLTGEELASLRAWIEGGAPEK